MEINHALSARAIGHYGCIGRVAISHHRRERDESRRGRLPIADCRENGKDTVEIPADETRHAAGVRWHARENVGAAGTVASLPLINAPINAPITLIAATVSPPVLATCFSFIIALPQLHAAIFTVADVTVNDNQ